MKPILFEKDATDFSTLGIARLPDAERCTVTEERNGLYELEMVYPVSGRYFSEITLDRIIAVIPHDGGTKQAFRIYATDTTIDGRVTFYARHISYQLNFIPIMPLSGVSQSAQEMLTALKNAAQISCPFSVESDIEGERSYQVSVPVGLRSAIGGMESSVIDRYGGELEWDNWTVRLHSARGADNGVRITYGKNLTDLNQSVDIGSAVTGVMAYWQGTADDGSAVYVYSSPSVITIDNDYAHERIVTLDLSSEFEAKPTVEQVTNKATAWINSTSMADPSAGLEIDFVPLWQTEEYKAFAPLERVGLCDTVYVGYKQLGVTAKKKVTKTVWNVLLDRYDKIELGGTATISDTIASIENSAYATRSELEKIPVLDHVDETEGRNFTLDSNYLKIAPGVTIPEGRTVVAITIIYWDSNTGGFSVYPYGSGRYWAYILGDSGTTINGLRLRYWYI